MNSISKAEVKNVHELDFGVKIGTKEEVIWTKVLKESKILIEQSEDNLIIQKGMMKLAEDKIAEEKEKLK